MRGADIEEIISAMLTVVEDMQKIRLETTELAASVADLRCVLADGEREIDEEVERGAQRLTDPGRMGWLQGYWADVNSIIASMPTYPSSP
jgi:hypothetical protein